MAEREDKDVITLLAVRFVRENNLLTLDQILFLNSGLEICL